MQMFGKPSHVMTVNLEGRSLALVNIEKVKESLNNEGFSCNCHLRQKIYYNNIKSVKRSRKKTKV